MPRPSRRRVLRTAGAGFATWLAGCSLVGGPPEPPVSPSTAGPIDGAGPGDWPHPRGDARGPVVDEAVEGPTLDRTAWWKRIAPSTVTVIDGVVYVDAVDEFYALREATGSTRWHLEVPNVQLSAIGNADALFLLAGDGRIWRYEGSSLDSVKVWLSERLYDAVVTETTLYLYAGEELRALDAATLDQRWVAETRDANFATLVATPEYVVSGVGFPGDDRFELEARASDAPEPLWTATFDDSIVDVTLDDRRCYVGAGTQLEAFSLADGSRHWRRTFDRADSMSMPWVTAGPILVTLSAESSPDRRELRSFDPATGETLPERSLTIGGYPLITDARAYTMRDRSIKAVDRETGTAHERTLSRRPKYRIGSAFAVTGDSLLLDDLHFERGSEDTLVCVK